MEIRPSDRGRPMGGSSPWIQAPPSFIGPRSQTTSQRLKVQAHRGLISPSSFLPLHRECRGSEDNTRVCSGGGVIWECRGSEDNTRVCSGGWGC